mmetsp:Transcript_53827/g.170946  ORF Transcript_53827/g.170946 Transcript_53827/m.170946 type:complete len:243 (-) Transcript_53827:375-1103(-)
MGDLLRRFEVHQRRHIHHPNRGRLVQIVLHLLSRRARERSFQHCERHPLLQQLAAVGPVHALLPSRVPRDACEVADGCYCERPADPRVPRLVPRFRPQQIPQSAFQRRGVLGGMHHIRRLKVEDLPCLCLLFSHGRSKRLFCCLHQRRRLLFRLVLYVEEPLGHLVAPSQVRQDASHRFGGRVGAVGRADPVAGVEYAHEVLSCLDAEGTRLAAAPDETPEGVGGGVEHCHRDVPRVYVLVL